MSIFCIAANNLHQCIIEANRSLSQLEILLSLTRMSHIVILYSDIPTLFVFFRILKELIILKKNSQQFFLTAYKCKCQRIGKHLKMFKR